MISDPHRAINLLVDYTKDSCRWNLPKPPDDPEKAWEIFWKMFRLLEKEFGLDVPDNGLDPYFAVMMVKEKFSTRSFLKSIVA